jgi:NAD(P)-dependent dehydrogenase (short-subunit alcohol dehydrogenase family)
MRRLSDRRIWITGASSGIGQALAVALARCGNTVVASGRSGERLAATQAACAERIRCLPFDITSRQANAEAARWIRETLGGLDVVVLNAGTCEYVDAKAFDAELVRRVTEINYFGFVYGVEAALPLLRAGREPYLVGMSSSVAYTGLPRAEAYGTTKAAIRHFLQALRVDLTAEGIDVSIICPGFVETPLTDRNDFPMPMRMTSGQAADCIVRGMRRRQHEIAFPWLFVAGLKLVARLPSRLRNRVLAATLTRRTA